MTAAPERFALQLTRDAGYGFRVEFDRAELAPLQVDELPPLGGGAGPNPVRLLAAAVGHCLAASLTYCLDRSRVALKELTVNVEGTLVRNAQGRLRIGELRVTLAPDVDPDDGPRLERCRELFEQFCIVTESVRQGIDVHVDVTAGAEALPVPL
jgi:uncharacterized OsmC-like protein